MYDNSKECYLEICEIQNEKYNFEFTLCIFYSKSLVEFCGQLRHTNTDISYSEVNYLSIFATLISNRK